MSIVYVCFYFSKTFIACLFIINEFSCFLKFFSLIRDAYTNDFSKVQKGDDACMEFQREMFDNEKVR